MDCDTNAYTSGREAFRQGYSITDNPYPMLRTESEEWTDGYLDEKNAKMQTVERLLETYERRYVRQDLNSLNRALYAACRKIVQVKSN